MPSRVEKVQFLKVMSLIIEIYDNYAELKRLNYLIDNVVDITTNIHLSSEEVEKVSFYLFLYDSHYKPKSRRIEKQLDSLLERVRAYSGFLDDE